VAATILAKAFALQVATQEELAVQKHQRACNNRTSHKIQECNRVRDDITDQCRWFSNTRHEAQANDERRYKGRHEQAQADSLYELLHAWLVLFRARALPPSRCNGAAIDHCMPRSFGGTPNQMRKGIPRGARPRNLFKKLSTCNSPLVHLQGKQLLQNVWMTLTALMCAC
jgi:hypothetical protein